MLKASSGYLRTLIRYLAFSIVLVCTYHSSIFLLKNVAMGARMQGQVEGHRKGFTEAAELYKNQRCSRDDLRT